MKKGKLVKNGKNWSLEGEKSLPVMGNLGLTEDMNGQEVEFDNTGGPVVLIRFNSKDYVKLSTAGNNYQNTFKETKFESRNNQARGGRNQSYHGSQTAQRARAPYNFVPLNKYILNVSEDAKFDTFENDKYSGFIDIEIEALTDIFIRGQLEKFFSVNGIFAIPGSSLRGVIRSLFEVISYSKMEMVERDRKLFFRNISDSHYKNIFLKKDQNTVSQKSKAGWIYKDSGKYCIQDAPTFYKININRLKDIGIKVEDIYNTREIWFNKNNIQEFHVKNIRSNDQVKNLNLKYNKINNVSLFKTDGYTKATLLITGVGSSKHFQWVIPDSESNSKHHDVTDIVNNQYKLDTGRDEQANLIRHLHANGGQRIPCFYIPDENGKPVAIGHTGIFRYPYRFEIGHAINQKNNSNIDLAKSIFGFVDTNNKRQTAMAGKIFFEDSICLGNPEKEFGALKILSSPKPTTFQHYLDQDKQQNTINNWDTNDHIIRGFKFYWHTRHDWRNPDNETILRGKTRENLIQEILVQKNQQYTIGEVLKSGTIFQGRIRFENISKAELGAILFVLDLPEDCAHKIGMGKPIGLGSIKITPKLTLINRSIRYQEIFDSDGNWATGEQEIADLAEYKNIFAQFIAKETDQLHINTWNDYWQNDLRMKELKCLLKYNHYDNIQDWSDRTRYMQIEHPENKNEYKDRPILPKPLEVINSKIY